jgi:hypothetical protein
MSNGSETGAPNATTKHAADPVVIDLGKHRKKRIKELRKGRPGKLMDEVMNALEALREDGTVAKNAQPIIVVVRQRRPSQRWPGL